MQLEAYLLLPLLLLCGCQAVQPPRTLTRCPADSETLVEPLPASVGDPVLLTGPGVELRTVDVWHDTVLCVESGRLLLNESINWAREGPYSGPHVILCSDASEPLATFTLYFKVPDPVKPKPLDPTASYYVPITDYIRPIAVVGCIAVAALLSVALAAVIQLHRSRRRVRDCHSAYRDFRHCTVVPFKGDWGAASMRPSEILMRTLAPVTSKALLLSPVDL